MMEILIILLTLSFINICVVAKCMTDLNKRIDELEKNIDNTQYQTDDVLCDINIVNENVLKVYGSLSSMKDEMRNSLVIKSDSSKLNLDYNYFPKTSEELREIIEKRIVKEGNEVDLNDIDVSNITDMSHLFEDLDFNGNISNWNVSNVTDMSFMLWGCREFNQDISNWNVSKVKSTNYMFNRCPIEEKYRPAFKNTIIFRQNGSN